MGGSGGGGAYSGDYVKRLTKAEEEAAEATFKAKLGRNLDDVLRESNDRDVALVSRRLDQICTILGSEVGEEIDTLYGGSVAKHTYVDGLSDVDTLLVVDETSLADSEPPDILKYIARSLREELGEGVKVTAGALAVTVDYGDVEVQLLPALRRGKRILIPDGDGQAWSEINPVGFRNALTAANRECSGRLVPLIKLAKLVNAKLPEKAQMSGYHLESLAIKAFRGYDGPVDLPSMLPEFFRRSSSLVLSPIVDRSGQSVHVDDYLGSANSRERRAVSAALDRTARKMEQAQRDQAVDEYMGLFDL